METTAQHRTGSQSLAVTPTSNPTTSAATVGVFACEDAAFNAGTLDLRGRTFTAFVRVPSSPGSDFSVTRCFLAANDPSFAAATIQGAGASVGPVPQNAFFTLTGTFANTAVESRITLLEVKCFLPVDWFQSDPTKLWFVDDISIQ